MRSIKTLVIATALALPFTAFAAPDTKPAPAPSQTAPATPAPSQAAPSTNDHAAPPAGGLHAIIARGKATPAHGKAARKPMARKQPAAKGS